MDREKEQKTDFVDEQLGYCSKKPKPRRYNK